MEPDNPTSATSAPIAASLRRTISREDLANLGIRRYDGPVCLVTTAHDLERAAHEILRETVVGFDTETQPSFRKGVSHLPSLVQVATHRTVYLFQLKRLDVSELLISALEKPGLVKAGVAMADDLRQLKQHFHFEEKGVVDLGLIAQKNGLGQSGVRNLAGMFLEFRVTKGKRTSNWGASHLSQSQIIYAATDAWVCRELYLRFRELKLIP